MCTACSVGTIPGGHQARPTIREHPSRTWGSGTTSSGTTSKNDRRCDRCTSIYRASRNRRKVTCGRTAKAGRSTKACAGQGPRRGLEHVLGRNTAPASPRTSHHVWCTQIRTWKARVRAQPAEGCWGSRGRGLLCAVRPSVACPGAHTGNRKRCTTRFERCNSRAQLCTRSSAAIFPDWPQGRIIRAWASNN
jgi:hypothetical protein